MKPIEQDELYEHFSQFLKSRGFEMKEGPYIKQLQKGCSLLTDAVNLTQQGMERAKAEIDKRLAQMRQVIHEKTAPKSSANVDETKSPGASNKRSGHAPAASTSRHRKKSPPKKRARKSP